MKIKTTVKPSNIILPVTIYLKPIIHGGSEFIAAAGEYDPKKRKYVTDINPSRQINGPLSGKGEMLEPPLKDEWDHFVKDCRWLIEEVGFTIIKSKRSDDSKKSEYILMFGMDDDPCGTLVFDLRISDHPLDAIFPEEFKDDALEYLQMNKILDGSATKAGIDFQIEYVTVGSVKCDSWNRAYNRLFDRLKNMRNSVRSRNSSKLKYKACAISTEGEELRSIAYLNNLSACRAQFIEWEASGYSLSKYWADVYQYNKKVDIVEFDN